MTRDVRVKRRYSITLFLPSLAVVSRLFVVLAFSLFSLAAQAEVRVLTSIKPLQLIAAAVQGDLGQPEVLLPPGASPHHFALRPSDVRRVQSADLLYWIGPDMETFLPRVLNGRAKPSVAVQDLPGLTLRHFGEGEHEHHDEHGADEHDHEHRPGSLDAHLWLLPANARVIAAKIAADLSTADPANATRYRANLQAFEQRLSAADAALEARLAPLASKPFFVFHQAFDYFESAYGLQHAGVFTAASEVQSGARHVAAMRERLQATGPACVFSEPPLRPRLADTLSAGLPVKLAELDALGAKAASYEQLLTDLGSGLAGCLESL
jgi:zinc transport system substrate-binding protein